VWVKGELTISEHTPLVNVIVTNAKRIIHVHYSVLHESSRYSIARGIISLNQRVTTHEHERVNTIPSWHIPGSLAVKARH
jgi:hypothetical protein